MGPKDREELEIWTRFACAAVPSLPLDEATSCADRMLFRWRARRDAIEAAEREAEAARKAQIRAALNAAPWVPNGVGLWTRYAMGYRDDSEPAKRKHWLFGLTDAESTSDWPEGFGDPPPGWVTP